MNNMGIDKIQAANQKLGGILSFASSVQPIIKLKLESQNDSIKVLRNFLELMEGLQKDKK